MTFLRLFGFVILALATVPANAQTPNQYDNVPDAYIQEAIRFHQQCEGSIKLQQHYDCECLAVKYLDTRIEKGEEASGSSILLAISKTCADGTYAAGYYYETCMGNAAIMPRNIPPEQFCTCFGNTFAQLYEQYSPGTGSKANVELQAMARSRCRQESVSPR